MSWWAVGVLLCVRESDVCVCVFMGVVGAAENANMLKGAEGQAACTALAKALPACTSLQELALASEWCGKAWT